MHLLLLRLEQRSLWSWHHKEWRRHELRMSLLITRGLRHYISWLLGSSHHHMLIHYMWRWVHHVRRDRHHLLLFNLLNVFLQCFNCLFLFFFGISSELLNSLLTLLFNLLNFLYKTLNLLFQKFYLS